ncbi:MAG: CsgG/HfaB family protein [Puniceicoccaceae bacterium]
MTALDPAKSIILSPSMMKLYSAKRIPVLSAFLALSLCLTPAQAFLFSGKDKVKQANSDLDLPPYNGAKHAIAVIEPDIQSVFRSSVDLGTSIRNMLESSLYDSERFVVVERESLGSTIREQDLAGSGRASGGSEVAQTGLIRSAKYLAKVIITDIEDNVSGGSGGFGIGGFRIGASGSNARIAMIVSIVDSTTSEILAKERIEGEAGRKGLNFGYVGRNWGTDLGGFAKTPLGEAAYDCVVQATRFVALKMEDYRLDGQVVLVTEDGQIIVNRGQDFNIQPGMVFTIREKGKLLIDPASGAVLEKMEGRVISEVKIDRVSDKVSYGSLVSGTPPQRGDSFELSSM